MVVYEEVSPNAEVPCIVTVWLNRQSAAEKGAPAGSQSHETVHRLTSVRLSLNLEGFMRSKAQSAHS